MSDTPRVPWLASDLRRLNIASVPAMLLSVPVYLLTRRDQFAFPVTWLCYWGLYAASAAALIALTFGRLSGDRLRLAALHGRVQERGLTGRLMRRRRWRIFLTGGEAPTWSALISVISLAIVVALAVAQRNPAGSLLLASGVVAVLGSWLNILFTFALHYARIDLRDGALGFPGEGSRAFSDYFYLAVAGQVTFGTTDVEVRSRRMRRAVTWHALVAFAFNTVIVAILVSLLVS
ncbi:hypothetical protein CGZ93_00285 [Enemella dayhoffiae]|uniref:DUF1345 domain-containing protein n=1 Tax=Enemella dayhoffiae TaxID=2016507 RepID=A0A255HDF2_9ACTN|nr:DUF1345 domain-containing protein [Enemella dayhoffiae]OYO24953.1 hypothetical protein CGZ93_00285 [Enemella dayhoffiae]